MHTVRAVSWSSVWGKMRIIVQAAAPEIALRSCCKEAAGKVRIYMIFDLKGLIHANMHIFFCKRLLLVTRSSCRHEGC